MTGSATDPPDWQPHIRNKPRREALVNRFRDASDPLKIVLVRDMWLTGFDVPSLHTMYLDNPRHFVSGTTWPSSRPCRLCWPSGRQIISRAVTPEGVVAV